MVLTIKMWARAHTNNTVTRNCVLNITNIVQRKQTMMFD